MKNIQTVWGGVNSGELGVVLYHEHLSMKPGDEEQFEISHLNDPEKMIEELSYFKKEGGGTIADMTPLNFGRNIRALKHISKEAGVHVICCTGFHKRYFIPDWAYSMSEKEIESILLKEITIGINGTDVKAGVIKIGTSREIIFPIEEKMIAVVSKVHRKTNVPVSTHCDQGEMALEQCDLFLKNNVPPDRVLLGHVDIPNDIHYLKEICRRGFNAGIDHVGRDLAMHDSIKIKMIRELIDAGYIKQIFISGDMGKKNYLKTYGGAPGLDYILTDFKSYFLEAGLDDEDFDQILVENPRRFYHTVD